eukprot:TRINITY_DN24735_c0_g1_i1.p1 TRINITY_DN24735_c0_g1~~TRINITY_DN24735_c0_g1_i1.p1  ORF type:complete len:916 (+),score=161.52 TRINITY_DN24735_c0_g1_i1:50-2749(+)
MLGSSQNAQSIPGYSRAARLPIWSQPASVQQYAPQYMPLQEVNIVRSSSAASPGKQEHQNGSQKDVVGFFAPALFVKEGEDEVVRIKVIRSGSLQGRCSVLFRTEDESARLKVKYKACKNQGYTELKERREQRTIDGKKEWVDFLEGTVELEQGECWKDVVIGIIEDSAFDTTLQFGCRLSNPQNCCLEQNSKHCRVMISDDDIFPDNAMERAIDQCAEDETKHLFDHGFQLLWYFFRFCFLHVDDIWWKSLLMVLLAQVGNAYYLATLYLRVYLVDIVLNIEDPSSLDRLLVPENRAKTAMLMGALWVLPNFFVLGAECIQIYCLEMGFNIRKHLRVNIFRKYLNYTSASRAEVPLQDLKAMIMDDIPDLVSDGYLAIFEFMGMAGKLAFVTYFLMRKHWTSGLPVFGYMVIIALQFWCTYGQRMNLSQEAGDAESTTVGWVLHACHAHKLVASYRQRNFVVHRFEKVLKGQREFNMRQKKFDFWNSQVIPWITVVIIGSYFSLSGHLVPNYMSLGSLLATINIYKDLGDRFSKISDELAGMIGIIEPLCGLTEAFYLETELPYRTAMYKEREVYAMDKLLQCNNFDLIPLELKEVKFVGSPPLTSPSGGRSLSITVPQNTINFFAGPHGSGKGSLMCLMDEDAAVKSISLGHHSGTVLCSPHLRILNVPADPLWIEGETIWKNLVFGLSEESRKRPEELRRAKSILKKLKIVKQSGEHWIHEQFDEETKKSLVSQQLPNMEDDDDEDSSDDSTPSSFKWIVRSLTSAAKEQALDEDSGGEDDRWIDKLSSSETKRFQLARAFIYDPEVLILHRAVDGLDLSLAKDTLELIREFVDNRGLEKDSATRLQRRPKTVFISGADSRRKEITNISDTVWEIKEGVIESSEGLRKVTSYPYPA